MTTISPAAIGALRALPRSARSQPWAVVRLQWGELTASCMLLWSSLLSRQETPLQEMPGRPQSPPTDAQGQPAASD